MTTTNEETWAEDEKRVNKLVERLGRCVGGKLADDVAAEVKGLWARVQGAENRAQSAEATLRLDKQTCIELQQRLDAAEKKLLEHETSTAADYMRHAVAEDLGQ